MNGFFGGLAASVRHQGIIPVFCPKDEREFRVFMDAMTASPLRVVEITLRSRFAAEAISRIKKEQPSFIVGAGTILSHDLLNAACDAGADFLVAPGCSQPLLNAAKGMPFLPGCATPTEIQNALMDGYTTLKYFPAECSGGVDALKLYAGAFSGVSFVPTGGITLKNLPGYLAQKNVLACGGSFMIPKDMLAVSDSEGIYRTVMDCLAIRGGAE